jgi:hypothetical protein
MSKSKLYILEKTEETVKNTGAAETIANIKNKIQSDIRNSDDRWFKWARTDKYDLAPPSEVEKPTYSAAKDETPLWKIRKNYQLKKETDKQLEALRKNDPNNKKEEVIISTINNRANQPLTRAGLIGGAAVAGGAVVGSILYKRMKKRKEITQCYEDNTNPNDRADCIQMVNDKYSF